jgi:hypothetical protein
MVFCLLAGVFAYAQQNLILNPGFETTEDETLPADWILEATSRGSGDVTFELATNPVYEGSKSLKVTSTGYEDSYAYQYIDVTAGKKYILSAWFNVESFEEEYGSSPSFTIFLQTLKE